VAQEQMVPVTILTGFLGSGKTTLLNRILRERHGHRIAVIENEFGEEGIDNDLLLEAAGEQIIEMNNGCLCCTVRGDLIRILGNLKRKREAGEISFERVIIETTGMADPGPVAQTFFMDDDIGEYYLLDSVITLVDAKHAPRQLDEVAALRERLVQMNPRAPIKAVHFGQAPIEEILDIRGFNLNAILELDPEFLEDDHHHHADDVSSFVFRARSPFDGVKLEEFLSSVIQVYGQDLLRYKGILSLRDNPHRVVFQGVHMLMGGDLGRQWGADESRESVMVFIGRKLPKDVFIQGLEQCLVKAQ
jgi:G3E family GTPase